MKEAVVDNKMAENLEESEGNYMRVMLKIAYDGTAYHGWQYQDNGDTVEGEIRKALNALLGKEIETIGASRTDAGVHALSNVCVFDTDSTIPGDRFSFALNDILPGDIRITESGYVDKTFNPRFDAHSKTYIYSIYNGPVHLPTKRLYSYHYRGNISIDDMNAAAKYLVGEHDFTSLSSVHAQVKSRVRTIYDCRVRRLTDDENTIEISVTGNGFLYNMVRIIGGTLLEIGIGKISPNQMEEILLALDRTKAGRTLPACGLRLVDIEYPSLNHTAYSN